jgi:hypothetical protein
MLIGGLILVILACNTPIATPTESVPSAVPVENTALATHEEGETSVKLTLVTGEDGTADNPVFRLFDSTSFVFTTILDNPGDLQPNQTDIYEFSVPYSFCQIIGFDLAKPSSSGVDDSWLLSEYYLEMDGREVSFERLIEQSWGPILEQTQPINAFWSGTDIYLQECGH